MDSKPWPTDPHPQPRVLFIGGFGRSGSTVLARTLAAHPEIVAVGEIAFADDELGAPDQICSCGERYAECGFWADLQEKWRQNAPERTPSRSLERVAALPLLWLGLVGRRRRERYARDQRALLEHARSRSGRPIVVDSSKSARLSAGRPLALQRVCGEDVYLLHVVRDARSTMESITRGGSNRQKEGRIRTVRGIAFRAAWGWTRSNLIAMWLGSRLGRSRYLRLRFEDFLGDPKQSLDEIGRLTGVDMAPVVTRLRRGGPLPMAHMLGGNRVRFDKSLTLREPEAAAKPLEAWPRFLYATFCRWLNRRLGYAD